MPASRRNQSNAMLYALVTFVGLFIAAAAVAVIYYIKFEEQRTKAETFQNQKNELATNAEFQKRGALIGAKKNRETYLGKMVDYLDEMVALIIGGPLQPTSAEVKVDNANRKVKETLELLAQEHIDIETIDPNITGLTRIIEKLKTKLVNTTNTVIALNDQLEQLHNRFDDFQAETQQKEQTLLAEKEKYEQQVYKIKQDYDKLQTLIKQTTEQQVQTLMADKDRVEAQLDKTRDKLLKTQAQLKMNQDRLKRIQQELWKVAPPPDSNVPAYKPDGKIMLVDNQIVHLNIGSDNRVYRGLTFSVYEKDMPIPKDGKGKAEIEVFDVGKNFAAARITHSEKRMPIVVDDIVANLVWDSDRTNVFVVAGEFDLDGDGNIDYDGGDKIKALIEKWGGSVADTVSTKTDFLVLGRPPRVPRLPTVEDIEVDPMATEKYEAASQKLAHYNQIQSQAQTLWIPVFNTERFLYFIGYKALVNKAMAF